MELSVEQVAAFQRLEETLWIAETRGNRTWMDAVLSPSFTEHGRSGAAWSRADILDAEVPNPIPVVLPLIGFTARLVDSVTVLTTYTCREPNGDSTRSSLWCHNGSEWRLEFHQGTPVPRTTRPPLALDPSELRVVTFTTTLRGYNRPAVDGFLHEVADRLDAGDPPSPVDVARTRFELSVRGYDPTEVDEFMARVKEGVS